MPTYEYRCLACGRQVEVMHGIEAPGPAECAVCGGVMRKALSTPAIHFKGSGWAKKDAQATARAKPATDTSTDSKPGTPGVAESRPGGAPDQGSSGKAADSSSSPGDAAGAATKAPTGSAAG